ncbi:MAG: hypothetical protein M3014_13795 [Chloroflexota bacterium]|nr:hypothetical protein [Chloroflexota bacterium]
MTNSANNRQTSGGDDTGTSGHYSWLEDYSSGNYANLPHDEIYNTYRSWSKTASPEELHEGTQRGYESLPQDQWKDAATHLHGYSRQRGVDLSDLDLSSANHEEWNAQDLARVTGRAYGHSGEQDTQPEQKKEHEGGGVPKPLIGLALAGALAFAASKVVGGKGEDKKDKEQPKEGDASMPRMTTNYATDTSTTSDRTGRMSSDISSTMGSDELSGDTSDSGGIGGIMSGSGSSIGRGTAGGDTGSSMSSDSRMSGAMSSSGSTSGMTGGSMGGGSLTDSDMLGGTMGRGTSSDVSGTTLSDD